MPHPAPCRRQFGASLVEAMMALAITGILAGSMLPGWHEARERRQLQAASAQLATDLRLTRSLALAQGQSVRLRVHAAQACYVVHTGPANGCSCDRSGQALCSGEAVPLRVATLPGNGTLALSSSSGSMLFDAGRGTVTPTGTLRLHTADGRAVHHVVNIMGRVRTCSPGARVAGHAAC